MFLTSTRISPIFVNLRLWQAPKSTATPKIYTAFSYSAFLVRNDDKQETNHYQSKKTFISFILLSSVFYFVLFHRDIYWTIGRNKLISWKKASNSYKKSVWRCNMHQIPQNYCPLNIFLRCQLQFALNWPIY